jgi:hypothetical protein
MADADLMREVLRAAMLGAGQGDAASALTTRAAEAAGDISDDLARELFGFFNGIASGLVMCGRPEGAALLEAVKRLAPTADEMRSAIKAALKLIAA